MPLADDNPQLQSSRPHPKALQHPMPKSLPWPRPRPGGTWGGQGREDSALPRAVGAGSCQDSFRRQEGWMEMEHHPMSLSLQLTVLTTTRHVLKDSPGPQMCDL